MNENLSDLYVIERKTSGSRGQINWKPGQKELIADLYINQKMGYRKIGELFGEKLHYNTIKRIVESHGGKIRSVLESKLSPGLKTDLFEKIDSEEKAYWLGFLSADGCVHKGYVKCTLQFRDKGHLEKLKEFLGFQGKITEYSYNNRKYVNLSVGSQKMYQDLVALGCIENKSLVLTPCQDIPEQFIFDYIRGYWDGDGGISYSQKSNRWQAYCTSTKEMLTFIAEKINLKQKPFLEHRCKNTYRISFNGRINVYKKLSLLYENATIFLDRKKELYDQLAKTMLQQ